MSITINNTAGTGATYSAGGAGTGTATGSSGGGGMSTEKLLELIAKIMEKADQKLESALQKATDSDDKTAMLRATSAQGQQQAAFTAVSNLVKADNENKQTAARRN
jgi:hypothetical protein